MELSDYIRILRKRWLMIVALMLVGVGLGAIASIVQRPVFSASTQVFVATQAGDTSAELAQGNTYTLSRVKTYASLASSQEVLQLVADELGLDTSTQALASHVSAETLPDTTIIVITATSDDPQLAADIANATASSLATTVQTIESTPDVASPIQLTQVETATTPSTPVSPRPLLNIALGGVLGLAISIALALMREVLDTRIRSEREVKMVTSRPVVGGIAFDTKAKQRPLIVHADPLSPRSESFRTLRTNLQFVEIDGASRSFVITSSVPGEGKSTTTANLALALADAGQTVILIDADLRKPKVAEYMNIEGRVGLTDVLIGRAQLVDAVQEWGRSNLYVLPAGQVPPNPSELLGSRAMATLIKELESEFDWVIFDAPPLLPVTDAAILSKQLGGVIMIVAAGTTTRHQLGAALGHLEQVDASVAGIVLTMVPTKGANAYGYGHYGYGYQQAYEKSTRKGALAKIFSR